MAFFNFGFKRKKNIHLTADAKGDLALSEEADVTVKGAFEGGLRIRGNLTVEKEASVRGRIIAENVFVKGKVCEDIQALEAVELFPGAELRGDVKASSLIMQKGACFWGACEVMAQSVRGKKKETSMTPEETAQFLQIDVDTVLELAENKKIPASRADNGTWFFDRIDLERWISENSLTPSPVATSSEVLQAERVGGIINAGDK